MKILLLSSSSSQAGCSVAELALATSPPPLTWIGLEEAMLLFSFSSPRSHSLSSPSVLSLARTHGGHRRPTHGAASTRRPGRIQGHPRDGLDLLYRLPKSRETGGPEKPAAGSSSLSPTTAAAP